MSDLNFFQENLFSSLQNPVLNDGDTDVTPHYRDIHFLITKKSLDALDPSSLSKFLEPLNNGSSNDIQLSDDDLFKVVQSRYIQQPSDVKDFAELLTHAAEDIKSKYTDYATRNEKWKTFLASLQRSGTAKSDTHSTSDDGASS